MQLRVASVVGFFLVVGRYYNYSFWDLNTGGRWVHHLTILGQPTYSPYLDSPKDNELTRPNHVMTYYVDCRIVVLVILVVAIGATIYETSITNSVSECHRIKHT